MKTYTAAELARRKEQTEAIGRIELLPQEQRWLAIRDLLFKVNPEIVPVDRGHIAAIREEREMNARKTGSTDSGSKRRIVCMPAYLHTALKLCDPEFMKADLSKDPEVVKKLYRKVWQVFPMYRACDVI